MKKSTFSAPKIDEWIHNIKGHSQETTKNDKVEKQIKELFSFLKPVKPKKDYSDTIWRLWLRVKRGTLEDYGDYEEFKEERVVQSKKEFEELWRMDYPEEEKWYELVLVNYKDEELFFNFDEIHTGSHLKNNEIIGLSSYCDEGITEGFFDWITETVQKEVQRFVTNPKEYNVWLQNSLPYRKRVGKLRRMALWEAFSDIERLDETLGANRIKTLEKVVKAHEKIIPLPKMTSGRFFQYCEIGHDANEYFKDAKKPLTPKEKYLRMADGRDMGLRDIDEESEEAFDHWYRHGAHAGGHPFEICRGGNSTHISLFVSKKEDGWELRLAGSRRVRVAETVRMAVSLFEKGIPFFLDDAEEILRMVQGIDFIGIVPEDVTPRYCHGLFPKEDRIIDFLNPWTDTELAGFVTKQAEWYPIDRLNMA